jgi:UDP-glucose 4-epimerase
MKEVCVFGGSGFLGSHVADRLSESGYSVKVFDREPSPWIRSDQEMIIGDILSMEQVSNAVSNADVVYNFAALADLNQAMSKPLETIRVNILGNANVLDA